MLFLIFLINCIEPFASFSNTYQNVQKNSEKIWKFERYHLINEYDKRPPLPPPFILLCHIYMLIVFLNDTYHGGSQQQEKHLSI